jgi:hypothetical protein
MKDILHYSMLQAYPQIIVGNLKDESNSSGGFASTSQGVDIDLNYIQWNDIDGASLTTRNVSDISVNSTTVGIHGRTDVSINNPAGGDHRNNCFVTLPAGKYIVKAHIYCKEFNMNSDSASFELFNLSDASTQIYFICTTGNSDEQNNNNVGKFEISSPKNFSLRAYAHTSLTPGNTNLGGLRTIGQKLGLLDRVEFTKIG